MVDAAGRVAAVISLCVRVGKHMEWCDKFGMRTYPAIVQRLSFQGQCLVGNYAPEEGKLGLCDWDPERQTRIRCSSLQPKNIQLHKPSPALVISYEVHCIVQYCMSQ